MEISIRAFSGSIKPYKELLEKWFDYDKHYHIYKTYNYSKPLELDELKGVHIETVAELFDISKEFEEYSYDKYQIAIRAHEGIIYIFDTYVE